jgi:ketosteroid isomerase-like protein
MPDITWDVVGTGSNPTFGKRQGPDGVAEFFKTVGETWDFSEFAPREFYPTEDKVFVLGRYSARCRRGGGEVSSEFAHVFTIRDGRVASFQEFSDSARIEAAFCG